MRRLLVLFALLPLAVLGLLGSDAGLGALARLAAGFVPGLQVEGVSGPLPGRLNVARLRLTDERGVWLEVEDAALALDWRALFSGRVHLTQVTLGRIALARLPAGDANRASGPPGLPRLPVAVSIDALAAPRIELGAALLGQAAALALEGEAALGDAALTARLALRRLDLPGEADLTLALDGEALRGQLAIREPPGGLLATLAGQPEAGFAGRLDITGPAAGADWRLAASLGAARAALEGRLALAPDFALASTAQGSLSPGPLLPEALRPLADEVTLNLAMRRAADGALAIERLALTLPAGRLEGSAGLSAAGALTGQAAITAGPPDIFAPLLPPGLGWRGLEVALDLAGRLDQPEARLRATVTGPRVAPQADAMLGETLTLDARYADGGIDATAAAGRLGLTLRGAVAEPFALAFTGEARDPPGLTGVITTEGTLRGTRAAPAAELTLRSDRLAGQGRIAENLALTGTITTSRAALQGSGQLDRKPFTLDLAATGDASAVTLENLAASWSGLSLSGRGGGALPGGPFTGALRLEAPDLSVLGAGVTGRLSAALEGRALPGAVGPAAQGVTLRLNGQALGIGGLRPSVTAEADGSLDSMDFRFAVTAPQGGLDLAGRFRQAEEARISLTRLDARAGEDALRLAAPALLRISPEGAITLDPARLLGRRGGSLAVQGRLAGGQLNGRAELAALPLAPLSAGLVSGTVSGLVTAAGPTAAPLAEARLRVDGLRAADPALAGLPAGQLSANARWQGQALRGDARLTAGPGVQLSLDAAQPRGLGAEAPFEAALRGQLDLGVLSRPFLDAGGERLTGRVQLNLRASGTPARPLLAGDAVLAEGGYSNPLLGARLDGIAARLVAGGQRLVVESLSARTLGGGTISAEGWLEPLGAGIPAELRLRAAAARPVSGTFGEAVLDADLLLRGPLTNGGSLAGRVDIRRAELRIPDSFSARVPRLDPVREVGPLPPGRRPPAAPRAAPARPSLPMALQLTLAAPRAVFLRGRGVEAELGGEITIGGTVASPVPQGALRLRRGSVNLVGRQLQFSRGLIGFDAGSFTPSLDFLASARSRSHTINLAIKGDPAAPEVTLTAEPDLPQDEALARLLFDRETSRLSPFELASIAQALAQLSGVAPLGGGVLDRLRGIAGLDRLGVGSNAAGGATVEAGRYVAPGVYLGLRQGTGGGAPGVGVQVEITPRLRLEGETATGPAGDRVGVTWEYEY